MKCREELIDFSCYEMTESTIISKHFKKPLPGSKLGDTLYRKVSLKCVDGKKRDFLYHRVESKNIKIVIITPIFLRFSFSVISVSLGFK